MDAGSVAQWGSYMSAMFAIENEPAATVRRMAQRLVREREELRLQLSAQKPLIDAVLAEEAAYQKLKVAEEGDNFEAEWDTWQKAQDSQHQVVFDYTNCMCDGGGSIRHTKSAKCTS